MFNSIFEMLVLLIVYINTFFCYRIVMKQLLEAVEFIHNKNIVHRHLKVISPA
jgi:serine/threonine protein kinase